MSDVEMRMHLTADSLYFGRVTNRFADAVIILADHVYAMLQIFGGVLRSLIELSF